MESENSNLIAGSGRRGIKPPSGAKSQARGYGSSKIAQIPLPHSTFQHTNFVRPSVQIEATQSHRLPRFPPSGSIISTTQKLIPLPGFQSKLAAIPKPVRASTEGLIKVPTMTVQTSSLLPKPMSIKRTAKNRAEKQTVTSISRFPPRTAEATSAILVKQVYQHPTYPSKIGVPSVNDPETSYRAPSVEHNYRRTRSELEKRIIPAANTISHAESDAGIRKLIPPTKQSQTNKLLNKSIGQQSKIIDQQEFREKYGITQSPKMRQLLELTSEWNQKILEPDSSVASRKITDRHAKQKLVRNEAIDNNKQKDTIEKEYNRILEERQKTVGQKPLSILERNKIRERFQKVQETQYFSPTEEELDNHQRFAKIMELQDAGVSLIDTPDKTVEILFPDTTPKTEIGITIGDVLIPREIPIEEMHNVSSLDRNTAEVALNSSLVHVPVGDAAKVVLQTSLQEITTQAIQPVPQSLDPLYEINLKLDRPKRQNLIQLQGSSQPFWFPGFHAIFPGSPGLLQITKSPSDTLLMAQRKIQPSVAF